MFPISLLICSLLWVGQCCVVSWCLPLCICLISPLLFVAEFDFVAMRVRHCGWSWSSDPCCPGLSDDQERGHPQPPRCRVRRIWAHCQPGPAAESAGPSAGCHLASTWMSSGSVCDCCCTAHPQVAVPVPGCLPWNQDCMLTSPCRSHCWPAETLRPGCRAAGPGIQPRTCRHHPLHTVLCFSWLFFLVLLFEYCAGLSIKSSKSPMVHLVAACWRDGG